MKRSVILVVMLVMLLAASCAQAAVVADSQASYGGAQGNGGWNWMVWNGEGTYTTSSANNCPIWQAGVGWYTGEWFGVHIYGYMNQVGFSGDPSHDNWAITRWTSSVSGLVKISMNLGMNGTDAGKAHLWINGNEVWSQVLATGPAFTYYYYANLNAGDLVDFGSDSQGQSVSTLTSTIYKVETLDMGIVADSQFSFDGKQDTNNWNWMQWDGVGTYSTSSAINCPNWNGWGTNASNGGWYTNDAIGFGLHIYGYLNQLGFSGDPLHDNWAISRWTSNIAAPVKISMNLGLNAITDAGKGHLWINGNEVWSQVLSPGPITTYDYYTTLSEGDKVDFGNDSQGQALSNILATYKVTAGVIADSQAAFIGVQGKDNWNWMVWDGVGTYSTTSATLCPIWADWGGPDWNGGWYAGDWFGIHIQGWYTQIGFSSGHDNWAITRWTSTVSCPVKISMALSDMSVGDTGKGHLWINGVEVWSQILTTTDTTYDYYVTLNKGDLVDFGNDSQGQAVSNIKAKYMVEMQPIVSNTSLTGSVNLLNFDGDKTAVTGTVELNGTPYPLALDNDGKFTITGIVDGTYDVRIKASHWLAKLTPGVVVAGASIMDIVSLINGDVVESNEVDFDDINATRIAYGSFPGDDNWNERADVDGTGEVDFTDINIVRGNYGEIGD